MCLASGEGTGSPDGFPRLKTPRFAHKEENAGRNTRGRAPAGKEKNPPIFGDGWFRAENSAILVRNIWEEILNAAEFAAKWRKVELKERSAAQEHFLDLCRMLGHPTPAEADPTGETFCFEKGAEKHGGGDGFADVWEKDFFGWEYKGKHKDLDNAYNQLLLYRDALANPPLLVVCDLDRIVVHTNFTKTVSVAHEIPLEKLGEPRSLEILRAVFFDPEKLRPGKTSVAITQEAAQHFADMAESMRRRGLDSAEVAHFLDRVVFCLFAEDIGLLPNQIFTRITEKAGGDPAKFGRFIAQLFEAMSTGGEFGLETILHFNGNLFDGATVPELAADEVVRITASARLDWSAVEPSIFGTLFERGLDPAKRSQLGAHFTGKDDIDVLVEAVVMQPLRREWDETKQIVAALLASGKKKPGAAAVPLNPAARKKAIGEAEALIQRFMTRLQSVKVLDPACGSGNFLYVALQKLKDLEKTVYLHSMESGLAAFFPMVGPWQLYGIELNPYAHDLAQMTVWIGWLQWLKFNGFGSPEEPILRAMASNFRCQDAILDISDPAAPKEPDWPKVDFIVGNPPFLGGKMMRSELGDDYIDKLFAVWNGRVQREADLCCYWFEKARAHIEKGGCKRAGLLATQGVRGGANREVLKRIKDSGDIFWAVSDQDWILDGATVHVSMAAFDNGTEETRTLDGQAVATINANLTSAADITQAQELDENKNIAYMGDTKIGPFEIPESLAQEWLALRNPHGKSNAEVVRPWANAMELTRIAQKLWIVDFPPGTTESEAAQYEAPFEYIREKVKPVRIENKRAAYARRWWIHGEARPEVRASCLTLSRYLATPRVSKHRLFVWLDGRVLPDSAVIVFARSDDYFFGVLHSRLHEVWALALGTQLREKESGARYTPTTCFETFPMPQPSEAQASAIAAAAKKLDDARKSWLGDRSDRTRTLTNLYNKKPTWLVDAHRELDAAVFAAYGWDAALSDAEILEKLLKLNQERAGPE